MVEKSNFVKYILYSFTNLIMRHGEMEIKHEAEDYLSYAKRSKDEERIENISLLLYSVALDYI